MEETVYYGELACQSKYATTGKPCRSKAYWKIKRAGAVRYVCTPHSDVGRAKDPEKTALPKRSPREKEAMAKEQQGAHISTCEDAAANNSIEGRAGELHMQRMFMMKTAVLRPGILNILPNDKHTEERKDGLGLNGLSPKRLGPVRHGQPGLPDATCIENFHQANKVFPSELDINTGKPLPVFYERQLAMYRDTKAHRHKLSDDKKEHMRLAGIPEGGNGNHCAYSVFVDPDGTRRKYTYVQSRRYYCRFMEELAPATEHWRRLLELVGQGFNLCICGFDAVDCQIPLEDPAACERLFAEKYQDDSKPFGHEWVLAAMLVLPKEKRPWNAPAVWAVVGEAL